MLPAVGSPFSMAEVPRRRRKGAENQTRELILDAAERLLLEEGYASVTSRRLAARAALKSQLVHYYFDTIENIFVAVIRRRATRNLESMIRAVAAADPLAGFWQASQETEAAIFWQELHALANHRKAIRDEVRHYMEQRRVLQAAALERSFKLSGVSSEFPPAAWALLVGGVLHVLSAEAVVGLSSSHEEALELLKAILDRAGVAFKGNEDNASRNILV